MKFTFKPAVSSDANALAAIHTSVAAHLTAQHGQGPWSSKTSERGVLQAMRTCEVFVARVENEIVGTLRLTTKKPWAIDISYFTPARQPIYLLAMAIAPARQRQGLGERCLEEAACIARNWPADSLRLDAYDDEAGAGRFYARCGWAERGRGLYRGARLIYYELLLESLKT